MLNKIIDDLKEYEGVRTKPYDDATGKELIVGSILKGKLTIGVGRNLSDVGLKDDEIEYLLKNDINVAIGSLKKIFNDFDDYPENIKRALINMMFNLGEPRFRTFKKFIQAIKDRDYKKARDEAIDSRWCKQVSRRCKFIADLIYQE